MRVVKEVSDALRRATGRRQSPDAALKVDRERATGWVEGSLALVTALVPAIGYDAAARIAKQCAETGKTVREVCLEQRVLPREELERLLDARAQTTPHS